ncbi:hypothetical protein Glove_460g15 [Diversispora epigaea]|uniref:Uncharacterized protein n=1 Tax=Diversispora epigaea TaxID=1348612 RepID=A0A397GWY1_9GLOM|nr:hypothetical protein Glove_460g15 [Diversispora epigaea]
MQTRSKTKKDVPPTIASTSNTPSVPHLRKELSMSSGLENLQLGLSSPPTKIWVKYGNNQPVKIVFDGEDVDDLKEAIKKKLSPKLNDVAVDDITLRRHGEEVDLDPDLAVDQSFKNNASTSLQVIVNAPATLKRKHEESSEVLNEIVKTMQEGFSQLKSVEIIKASSLPEDRARDLAGHLGLTFLDVLETAYKPIEPISCEPFEWNMEISEDRQMSEVVEWFKDALNLSEDFHVRDVHNRSGYNRHIPSANVTLTGGTDISIGPSATPCVWVETKKRKENFKEGQAIGELFLIDKLYPTKSMSVLTDCKDNWMIYFFSETEDKKRHLTSSKIDSHGIALAIIKQFVLDEWKTVRNVAGPNIIYQTNLPAPLTKKIKLESIPDEVDDRMADVIDNMTGKELLNMSMRNRLKFVKSIIRIEEQPIIDQFIRQFSDDYENPPPLMYA